MPIHIVSWNDFMPFVVLKDKLEEFKLIGMTYAFELFMYVNNMKTASYILGCSFDSHKTRQ